MLPEDTLYSGLSHHVPKSFCRRPNPQTSEWTVCGDGVFKEAIKVK